MADDHILEIGHHHLRESDRKTEMCRYHMSYSFNFAIFSDGENYMDRKHKERVRKETECNGRSELYSKYKTASTEEEKRKSRQEYLKERNTGNFRCRDSC